MDKVEMERQQSVQRYQRGESATEISASLGRSVRWLYKWVERAESEGEWWTERSRGRHGRGNRSSTEMESLVVYTRQRLEREDGFRGAHSIAWELEAIEVRCPSIATINRILKRYGLIEKASSR